MALGLGLAAAPAAADLSEADTDQLRAMVRAYLLENPEVIIEALEIHQARQEELQAAKAQA
ncbi:MAG: DsbA family protein, partial [Pseudomonadota bacterium]|nr:DsbA family protein [Pseudomonadota bacterium]